MVLIHAYSAKSIRIKFETFITCFFMFVCCKYYVNDYGNGVEVNCLQLCSFVREGSFVQMVLIGPLSAWSFTSFIACFWMSKMCHVLVVKTVFKISWENVCFMVAIFQLFLKRNLCKSIQSHRTEEFGAKSPEIRRKVSQFKQQPKKTWNDKRFLQFL